MSIVAAVIAIILSVSASVIFGLFEVTYNCDDKKGYGRPRAEQICNKYATPFAIAMFASLSCGCLVGCFGVMLAQSSS